DRTVTGVQTCALPIYHFFSRPLEPSMRCFLPLLVLLSLAFAPAPFPKPRGGASNTLICLDVFQGRWKVVRMETTLPGGKRSEWKIGRASCREAGRVAE